LDALASVPSRERGAGAADLRRVGGRVFAHQGEAWVDVTASDSLRAVTVEPFSMVYFRLLEALPELKPSFAAFNQVVVGGSRVRVRVAPGGVEQMSDVELNRLVQDFRGR